MKTKTVGSQSLKNKPADRGLAVETVSRAFKAAKGDKIDIFVYGTLLDDNNVRMLLKRVPESVPAELHNFMKAAPKWSFPFIVKYHGAVTNGRILKAITKEELKSLDEFEDEGNLYKRQSVVARTAGARQRCMTYVGNIEKLQKSFGKQTRFEDRYSLYLERKTDDLFIQLQKEGHEEDRRVYHELAGAAVDEIIQSHFDGNYICNYIAIQALKDIAPPDLSKLADDEKISPYIDNYMKFISKHVLLNQIIDSVRRDFPDDVRLSKRYFRHGLAMLIASMYYNIFGKEINILLSKMGIDKFEKGKKYTDYIAGAIKAADQIYFYDKVLPVIEQVEQNWVSTPTPLGAELEFSSIGGAVINAPPGKDKLFDGFYWFKDFDLFRRTWRLGCHIDSHRQITLGQERHRGFLEYALGRYQIVGDLSRPLFDCPWGMSKLINEIVRFISELAPHSLHISFEIKKDRHSNITGKEHKPEDLVCLLMLGGDILEDENMILREKRIFNGELSTDGKKNINFSDRKHHFKKIEEDESDVSDVMEYKFMRLHRWKGEDYDYESIIFALKAYQFQAHGKTINPQKNVRSPEETFLVKWAEKPESIGEGAISSFIEKIEKGILEEYGTKSIDTEREKILRAIEEKLRKTNKFIKEYECAKHS
jgi:gamma-glutamylcyclotransferase (GGCT)/AIG2-like uncharacterized protein YtfP